MFFSHFLYRKAPSFFVKIDQKEIEIQVIQSALDWFCKSDLHSLMIILGTQKSYGTPHGTQELSMWLMLP